MPRPAKKKPIKKVSKKTPSNNLPIVGLVLAIFLAPIGLIVSIVALIQSRKLRGQNTSLPIIGIIIGSVLTIFNVVVFVQAVQSTNQATAILSGSGQTKTDKLPPKGSIGYNVVVGAFDNEKEQDIRFLSYDLDFYHSAFGAYPSFADLNSTAWRQSQAKYLSDTSLNEGKNLCDPSTTSSSAANCPLVSKPTKGAYSYQTWQADGVTPCTATSGQTCPGFTLTAVLESDQFISNNNSSVYYVKTGN